MLEFLNVQLNFANMQTILQCFDHVKRNKMFRRHYTQIQSIFYDLRSELFRNRDDEEESTREVNDVKFRILFRNECKICTT